MTQPVSPYSTRWRDEPPDAASSLPTATNGRPQDPPEPPEMPDFDAQVYARAARAMGSSPTLQNPALEALSAFHHAHDVAIQARLDAFRAQATPTYHTPSGDVRVATPFFMRGYPVANKDRDATIAACVKVGLSDSAAALLRAGRGTPSDVRRVTQALIDADGLPSDGGPLDDRVRMMMVTHGIGLDCVGYVAPAFVASRCVDRAQSQLASIPFENEQLSNLRYRGFMRVAVDDARVGDVVVLQSPSTNQPGHTAIVYAARDATEADKQFLRASARKTAIAPDDVRSLAQMTADASLRVIVVDSAWGSGQRPLVGGVERRMWWHDPLTGQWASTNGDGLLQIGMTPYEHPIEGAYRPRSEP